MPFVNSGNWSCLSARRDSSDARIITHQACRAAILSALFVFALSACQPLPPVQSSQAQAPQSAAAPAFQNEKRYIVDTRNSEIRLLVYRDGPMARFGHNHVMTGRVGGEISVSDSAAASGFRLEIPVESFVVDDATLRAEEGEEFAAAVSDQARKGTRDNMLGADILDAAHYPIINIESDTLVGPRWNPSVTARVTVRGRTSVLKFPAAVIEQAGSLTVVAAFPVLQSKLGIVPYSVLGGAIQVRDAIDIRVRLVALPATD